jgi:hypothetical protein
LYGLVGGELMWVHELAAFGRPLQPYASARLHRVDDEPPAGDDPTAGSPAAGGEDRAAEPSE